MENPTNSPVIHEVSPQVPVVYGLWRGKPGPRLIIHITHLLDNTQHHATQYSV